MQTVFLIAANAACEEALADSARLWAERAWNADARWPTQVSQRH
jgi:hypothetical protein